MVGGRNIRYCKKQDEKHYFSTGPLKYYDQSEEGDVGQLESLFGTYQMHCFESGNSAQLGIWREKGQEEDSSIRRKEVQVFKTN